jgi:hypothetical protein
MWTNRVSELTTDDLVHAVTCIDDVLAGGVQENPAWMQWRVRLVAELDSRLHAKPLPNHREWAEAIELGELTSNMRDHQALLARLDALVPEVKSPRAVRVLEAAMDDARNRVWCVREERKIRFKKAQDAR